MGFIEIKPVRGNVASGHVGDKVSIRFYMKEHKDYKPSMYMTLIIGEFICERFGFKNKELVSIFIDEDNPFLWQIRKSKLGFKLQISGKHLAIHSRWPHKTPSKIGEKIFCSLEMVAGNLQITFAQDEAKELDK